MVVVVAVLVVVENNRIVVAVVVVVENNRIVVVVVVAVEYLESEIFLYRSHPLQILFFSVLFCTKEGHNAKMWRFFGVFGCRFLLN